MTDLTDERLREMFAAITAPNVGAVVLQGKDLSDVRLALESLLAHRTNGGEAVAELESALNQFRHCQRQGPWWFTNGEPALRAMTERWLTKADEALAKLKADASPGTSGVRVKALEWRYYPDAFPPAWDAPTAFGRYSIEEGMIANTEDPTWHSDSYPTWNVDFSGGLLSVWRSLDEAKAAAQTDYETRILAALEPSP